MASGAEKSKICFVVGPIGAEGSETRTHADWLLEEIISPVFSEYYPSFQVKRADKISNPGQITSQVITALLELELVISDISFDNPNAYYEIGIRHTINRPVIHMHLDGQKIPFDIAPFRSIPFSLRHPAALRAARETLRGFVNEAIDPSHEVDNPATFSRGRKLLEEKATPSERVLQETIDSIETRLRRIEMATTSNKPFIPDKDISSDRLDFSKGDVFSATCPPFFGSSNI